ncbi:MAG: hypothetical protein U1A27_10830 [Phycisphaerae bacterium]
MGRIALYAMRAAGWGLLLAAVGLPLGSLAREVMRGPADWRAAALSARQWGIVGRTTAISVGAALLATLLALPAIWALTVETAARWRAWTWSAVVLPLLMPPAVFGYAWMLLGSQARGVGPVLRAVGFESAGAAPVRAAVALGTWLWPIPAAIGALAMGHGGRLAYRLALIDAGPMRALLHAALPGVRGPLVAAAALVFALALNEATIAPLVLAHTWPGELAPEVLDTALAGTPAAAMVWRSWPMFAGVAAAIGVALVSLRGVAEQSAVGGRSAVGVGQGPGRRTRLSAAAMVGGLALGPWLVFASELWSARTDLAGALRRAVGLYSIEWRASAVVALCSGVGAAMVAMALLSARGRAGRGAWAALAATCVAGLVPPALLAQAWVGLLDRPGWLGWMYDETPVAWVAAMLGRFGFVAVAAAIVADGWVGRGLIEQAWLDGADASRRVGRICVPIGGAVMGAAALTVSCLALSEVPAAIILTPVRFGGSLAVAVDNQMHYGRNADLIVTTGLLMIPGLGVAAGLPLLVSAARRATMERRG